jgi:ribosomal protein S18 acetylase RimI-like enzyme
MNSKSKVKKLKWDSNFFGNTIGRIDFEANQELQGLEELEKFDLVYIFSKKALNITAPLMDIKITFQKLTNSKLIDQNISLFNFNKDSYEQLLDLVYASGFDSRFNKDPFFGHLKFKKMYKKWINNSIKDEKSEVLIYSINAEIKGFVSFTYGNLINKINLIAVSEKSRGQGIGVKLLNAVETKIGKSKKLIVPTQETNIVACNFYLEYGFEISDRQYIYHYAKNTI